MGAICACVLFKRRKLYNFMHCTLYTYQAKQRMFQNIFHFSYFANLKSDSKPKLPTHNIKYFMYLLFEGCVVFQQLPPPLASLNYSHKRTMTSLGVLGQTKSHWLIQSMCPLNICPPKTSKYQNFQTFKENRNASLPFKEYVKLMKWWCL